MRAAKKQIALTTSPASLEAALLAILGCYDMAPDLKGILARLPRPDGALREEDIIPVCQALRLTVMAGVLDWPQVQSYGLPCLILYQDGSVVPYIPANVTHDAGLINEGAGEGATGANPIRATYLIVQPRGEGALDTGHMKHGSALDWFWEPVKRYWRDYNEILVASLFSNLLMLAMPIFTMNVYDRVAVNYAESTLIVLTVGIIFALAFDFLFKTIRGYVLETIAARIGVEHDVQLMDRLMAIKPTAMQLSIGEKANLFRELQGVKDFYASRLMPALVDVPFFILFVGAMYIIAPVLAWVPIIATVLIFVLTKALQIPINRSTSEYFKGMQNKTTTLVQTLHGSETIRLLGARGAHLFQWSLASQRGADTSRHNAILIGLSSNLSIMITYLVNVFVVVIGVTQVAASELTVGAVVACSLLSGRAISPIVNLSGLVARMKQSSDVLKAVDNIFALPHDSDTESSRSPKNLKKGSIEFADVSFAYPGQPRPALQNVRLTIRPGEHVGIIGRTGAGKSTLARLMTRHIEPVAGNIFIDGYAMHQISSEELHRSIGYVPQDTVYFTGSVRYNVLMGAVDVEDAVLANAVRMSGLDYILQSMGMGLDMPVGEGGKFLSGGQKQALSLARAFVRDPSILVFDEPVNGIDNALEATIKMSLEKYLQGRTFVMITHRTSLLSLVDRLILMEGGRVVADGPRDEIMARLAAPPQGVSHA